MPDFAPPPSLTQPLTGWQLNIVLQLPLCDGGLRYGQAKERRANTNSASICWWRGKISPLPDRAAVSGRAWTTI